MLASTNISFKLEPKQTSEIVQAEKLEKFRLSVIELLKFLCIMTLLEAN